MAPGRGRFVTEGGKAVREPDHPDPSAHVVAVLGSSSMSSEEIDRLVRQQRKDLLVVLNPPEAPEQGVGIVNVCDGRSCASRRFGIS